MENKILLSFAIPTYNRASFLEKLLNNVLPQARELKDEVEICISNNGSTDNTREVVISFQKKYPDLTIKYSENKQNLGVDANILKVAQMCVGDFIWTFGDDDHIVNNGLNIVLSFPQIAFISILIFNNKMLKGLLSEDIVFVKKGIGTSHIHMVLFSSMFLKYPHLEGIVFNKEIVCQELSQYKYFVEDKFMLHYQMQRKLNNLLLSYKYMDEDYAPLILKRYKGLKWDIVVDMIVMKAFKTFNYFSYFGCLKLFFQHSTFIDALLFSSVFSTLFLIPPVILTSLYKGLLIIRYGKGWKAKWNFINSAIRSVFDGTRRRNEQPH